MEMRDKAEEIAQLQVSEDRELQSF